MSGIVENVASAGDLAQCSPEIRVIVCVFMFVIILTLMLSLVDALRGLGK